MKIRIFLSLSPLLCSLIAPSSAAAAERASVEAESNAEAASPALSGEPAQHTVTKEAGLREPESPEALERAEIHGPTAEVSALRVDSEDDDYWEADEDEGADDAWEDEILPVRIGIGVGLSSRTFALIGDDATTGAPISFTNIHVPFYLGTSFRLEPEIGFYHQKGGIGSGLAGLIGSVGDSRSTSVRFLLGAQYVFPLSAQTIAYVGPKVGIQNRSMQFKVEMGDLPVENTEIRALDYWVGGSVGGEAFLTDHFSLGVEVDFFYVNLGETTALVGEFSLREGSHRSWILSTHGMFAARLYFL